MHCAVVVKAWDIMCYMGIAVYNQLWFGRTQFPLQNCELRRNNFAYLWPVLYDPVVSFHCLVLGIHLRGFLLVVDKHSLVVAHDVAPHCEQFRDVLRARDYIARLK